GTELPCARLRLGFKGKLNGLSQLFRSELLEGNRRGTSTGSGHHGAPEDLVAEEGHDDGGLPSHDSGGGSTGAAMVDNRGHPLKEPVMRAVPKHENTFRNVG